MLLSLILLVSVSMKIVFTHSIDSFDQNNEDFAPEKVPKPVPFGHIFKDGIDDVEAGYFRPIDLLELDMRYPRDREEEETLLRTRPKKTIVKIHYEYPFKKIINPRDEYVEEFMRAANSTSETNNTTKDDPKWFDFEALHRHNIENGPPRQSSAERKRFRNPMPVERNSSDFDKAFYFSHHSFDIPAFNAERPNWTSCEEFEKDLGPNNVVYPKDIVDIDWEPFYIWTPRKHLYAYLHRFTYPTKKIVQEYREVYERFLPKHVDWEQPKLVLTERVDMLLIAGDRKGLFYGVPKQKIPHSIRNRNVTAPTLDLRLKIIDPYLAMMYCNEFYATIMGTSGTTPQTDKEKAEEAALLKFKGDGYPISRNIYLEKLKVKGKEEQKKKEEARKFIHALPGYPGIDDIETI